MQRFSLEKLQKAQRRAGSQCFLRELRQGMRTNQRKITKSVYNLESRDIGKFTREWNQMRMKFRGAPTDIQPPKPKPAKFSNLTYDEDQALEMSFQIPFRLKSQVNESAPIRTEHIQQNQQETKVKPVKQIKTVKNRYSLKMGTERTKLPTKTANTGNTREKTQYMSSSKGSRREARQRFVTQWEPDPKEPKDSQRVSLKKVESPPHNQEHLMADLSRQRIDQYVRNLHRLEWSSRFLKQHPAPDAEQSPQFRQHLRKFKCDLDNPIDEQAINYMVSRRYNMLTNYLEDAYQQRSKQLSDYSPSFKSKEQEKQESLLNSLTRNSILKLIKVASPFTKKYKRESQHRKTIQQNTHSTLAFSLPYCEFISFRQTRSSVYQLMSMGNRTSLKLAFTIYDKNRNGVLDEDDLLQMISLSRTFTFVEADIVMIARAMSNKNKNLASSPQSSERTEKQSVASLADSGLSKKSKERNRQGEVSSAFSPIAEEEDSDAQSPSNALTSGRFKIDKLYTFLRGKEAEQNKEQGKIVSYSMKPLNFDQFCKAFRNERPMIIIDLFQFLLGAPLDHFHPNVKKIFANLQSKKKKSPTSRLKQDDTIDEKWSQRLRNANAIISSFLKPDK